MTTCSPRNPEPEEDVLYGSYGLDQCVAWSGMPSSAARNATGTPGLDDLGPDWVTGVGTALSMIDTVPPRGHFAHTRLRLLPDGTFDAAVGTAEFGNGTTTVHAQLAATALSTTARERGRAAVRHGPRGARYRRVRLRRHRGGRQGNACSRREELAVRIRAVAAGIRRCAGGRLRARGRRRASAGNRCCRWRRCSTPPQQHGVELAAEGRWGGTPRSVAFNVHGFRVAVNTGTGELRILQSVQAADAGVVVNPRQCRGQVEGGIAQALGAALYEEVRVDDAGKVTTDILRQYHIPTFADVPRSEVYFAETNDQLGPLGAKSMSESPFNPVAPALANAIRNATGVRFAELPIARDKIYLGLKEAGRASRLEGANGL